MAGGESCKLPVVSTTGAVALRLSLARSVCSTSHSVPILSALSNGSEARIKAQLGRPDCLTKGRLIEKGQGWVVEVAVLSTVQSATMQPKVALGGGSGLCGGHSAGPGSVCLSG
jgi:hypothetical protein